MSLPSHKHKRFLYESDINLFIFASPLKNFKSLIWKPNIYNTWLIFCNPRSIGSKSKVISKITNWSCGINLGSKILCSFLSVTKANINHLLELLSKGMKN